MQRCIFCRSTSGPFKTREHILPESLGGSEWAILPEGLFCDQCNNKFGSTVEQQALSDYPFSLLRVFLGIPTKKSKAPWLESWEGKIIGSNIPGHFGYEPASYFTKAIEEGRKTQLRILAHPKKPNMVCRTLLKMGLQVVAADNAEEVFDEKFDDARKYSLYGQKRSTWWYLLREDMALASKYLTTGVTKKEWSDNVLLEVINIEDGAEVFHLKLLFLDFITPLESWIGPPPDEGLQEPEYRLFTI